MKIILVDNLDWDTSPDKLIAENVNEFWARQIVFLLNQKYSGPTSFDYFKDVPDDYELRTYEP